MEPLWIDDPSILIKTMKVFPDKSMSKNEKYNSICRFILISNIFVSIYRKTYKNMIAAVLLCYLICLYVKKYDDYDHQIIESEDDDVEEVYVDTNNKEVNPRDNFIHSVYGEINNNRKMMVYNNRNV